MSVQNNQRLVQYVGNGSTTAFAVPFVFHANSHIYVYREKIDTGEVISLNQGSGYTLTGISNSSGGTVTISPALTNEYRITIARIVPYEQLTDYINNDQFDAESHERQMDLIVMQIQQNADPSNLNGTMALRFPLTEPLNFATILPDRTKRKGTVVGFREDTGEMVLYQMPLVTITVPPPPTGVYVYASVNGEMQWIETTNCV